MVIDICSKLVYADYRAYAHKLKTVKGVIRMPRGDGTGPMGMGPKTGRAAGYCTGYSVPGFANGTFGYCGRGGGRGFRCRIPVTGMSSGWMGYPGAYPAFNQAWEQLTPEREVNLLTKQIEAMEQALQQAKERLEGMKKTQE